MQGLCLYLLFHPITKQADSFIRDTDKKDMIVAKKK